MIDVSAPGYPLRTMTALGSEKRRLVIAKAAELFDRDGYHQVNMTQVARAAGIEKPTLYHYFQSKDEILYWIHETFIELLHGKLDERPPGASAREALVEVMCDVLDLMHTHRGHVRVFFEHHRELSPEGKASVREKRMRYQDRVQAIVAGGIETGELRPLDAHLTTLALFGMCNWAYTWYRRDGSLTSREVGEFLAELLLGGLVRRA
jgi:AcrR family transcriptional regulator